GAAESPERLDKLALLEGWAQLPGGNGDGRGLTAEEVLDLVMPPKSSDTSPYPGMHDLLMRTLKHCKSPNYGRQLSYRLRGMSGSNVGGMRFVKAGETREHATLWRVTKV